MTAFNLAAEFLTLPVVNRTLNLGPGADRDYYTWEITATRRQTLELVAAGELRADVESRRGDRRQRDAESPDQHRRRRERVHDLAGEDQRDADAAATTCG